MTLRHPCPCCGLPSLRAPAVFEVCRVCWWEDDGQSDADAGAPNHGPNGDLSLLQARVNFAARGSIYPAGAGIAAVETPSAARRALLDWLAGPNRDPARFAALLDAVEAVE
jgi:hypothetical protein